MIADLSKSSKFEAYIQHSSHQDVLLIARMTTPHLLHTRLWWDTIALTKAKVAFMDKIMQSSHLFNQTLQQMSSDLFHEVNLH